MYFKRYLNLHPAALSQEITPQSRIRNVMIKNLVCRTTILFGLVSSVLAADLDTARIDELTGLKGKMNEKEGVYKVTFPRNDVKIVVDGWTMPPFMGLGTWAAFTSTQNGAMVMGDTVLFEDKVNAAMSAALGNAMGVNTWAGFASSDDNAIVDRDFAVTEEELQPVLKSLLEDQINVLAINQHMTHEEPRILFFHYWGRGTAKELAQAVQGGFLVGGLLAVSSPLQN
jgi:Domain of Unknown Function (DUF1259)